MSLTDHRFSVLDKCTTAARYDSFNNGNLRSSGYSKEVRYINNTRSEIDFKERSGVVVPTKPMPNVYTKEQSIEIEIEWRMTNELFRKTADLLAKDHAGDPLLRIVVGAMDKRYARGDAQTPTVAMTVNISLSLSELQNAGGVMYLEELDLTITTPTTRTALHPYEPRERLKAQLCGIIPHIASETQVFSLKAICNDEVNKHHDRFMLLGDLVYRIPIEKDPNYANGVHVVSRRSVDAPDLGSNVVKQVLSFEEADKRFRLYSDPEMARKNGDPELHLKLQLVEYERQKKIDDATRKSIEAEETSAANLERLALERERLEYSRRKAQEDLTKDRAKNFSEWMGICGKVLILALGAITALSKLSTLKPA